jgi:CheY-like chemotaxis protein
MGRRRSAVFGAASGAGLGQIPINIGPPEPTKGVMIPCAEKFSLMVASPDDGVRGWLALAAVEAECYGLVVSAAGPEPAMGMLVRQAFRGRIAGRFDIVIADRPMPGLEGVGLIAKLKQNTAVRPFMARLLQPGEDPSEVVIEEGFDLFAPLPDSLEALTSLLQVIAQRCLDWYASGPTNPVDQWTIDNGR